MKRQHYSTNLAEFNGERVPCDEAEANLVSSRLVDYAEEVDPADTRDCDGYPGLAGWASRELELVGREVAALPRSLRPPCPCGDPADCVECHPGLVDYDVVVQGQAYTLRGSHRAWVRLLLAAALKRHVPPFQSYLNLNAVWEVRDAEGRMLEPDSFVDAATVGRVYVDMRSGWGG